MQVIVAIQIVQLASLAVTAAKLPLTPLGGPTQHAIRPSGNFAINSVPTPPSTLYGAPELLAPSQTEAIFQTPASGPGVISTLYEAPAEDVPSGTHTSVLGQNPIFSLPDQGRLPSGSLTATGQQPSFLQAPGIEIPVPDVPSSLYDLPSENLSTPPRQLNLVQPVLNAGPGPAQPSTAFAVPSKNVPAPSQSPITVLSPVSFVPVNTQQSNVAQTSVIKDNVADFPSNIQQPSLVPTPTQIVPVPPKPSTLYNIPDQTFALPLPSQPTPERQFPSDVFTNKPVPAHQLSTGVEIPQAPQQPSGLYEIPHEAQPTQSSSINKPSHLIKETPAPLDIFSQDVVAPAEPSGLYETPSANFPSAATFGTTQTVKQPADNIPAKGFGVPIQFPGQSTFQSQPSVDLVQVPAVPSGLYETPEASSLFPVKTPGKAMGLPTSSSQNTFSAVESSPVNSVAKGVMMMGMPYDFQWGVQDDITGNAFTHYETSDGKRTSGQYRVNLPDGRTQVVTFYDNGDGFNADVSYE